MPGTEEELNQSPGEASEAESLRTAGQDQPELATSPGLLCTIRAVGSVTAGLLKPCADGGGCAQRQGSEEDFSSLPRV